MERARRYPGSVWSRATLITEIIREGSLVIRQFVELSFVEFKLSHCDSPLLVILISRAEISNSFYSNVYLKVKQVCLEAVFRGCEAAAVLPIGYMKKSVISQLWTSSSAISSRSNCCCFAFECTRSNWYRKHNNICRKTYTCSFP